MKKIIKMLILFVFLFSLTGCVNITPDVEEGSKVSSELEFTYETKMDYAKNFRIYNYQDGYKLLDIVADGTKYLVVPEGLTAPKDLKEGVTVVQLPVKNLLISSTPTTSLINAMGDLDKIKLTTTKQSSWYIPAVIDNMKNGKLTYVGDYKEPDFEMLEANKPSISVWSTMLDTVPAVEAKLKELGIPYMLDYASDEGHPLARVEYTKLYGSLIGTPEGQITKVYKAQVEYVTQAQKAEPTNKTAAIFYITSKGVLYVRNSGDYITKMLTLAGGKYINPEFNPDKTGNTTMSFEDFYVMAKDADYIVYVWSLGGKPANLDQFTAKNELLKDFKAVKDGNVWCTTQDFFQIADTLGYMISDMSKMLNSTPETPDLQYLFRLK